MTATGPVTVQAPAKINLGLEILGKRADGYHEILTIMAAVGLYDTLTFTPVPGRDESTITGVDGVTSRDNLVRKAIDAFATASGVTCGYDVAVTKRIPSPGGLGGASSDAAATLMALNEMHGVPLSDDRIRSLAASLGSDVPFFTRSPVALASGTGTTLEPLPALGGWVVLAVPRMDLPAKTAQLYGSLRPDDFTDGRRVREAALLIRSGGLPDADLLHNAFTRPLYGLQPALRDLAATMIATGAPHVALSGAGPAHYTLFEAENESLRFATALAGVLTEDTAIHALPILGRNLTTGLAGR